MTERARPAEHPADFGDALFFHGGTGAPAIERVVVRIDPQRQGVGDARDRVRRLEHLPGVLGVMVGVVVVHAAGDRLQHLGCRRGVEIRRKVRQVGKSLRERLQRVAQ